MFRVISCLVFLLSLFQAPSFAQKIILKDHGNKPKNSKAFVKKEDEYCDLKDPSHCQPKKKKLKIDFNKSKFQKIKYKNLNKTQKELLDAAEKVSNNSYSPYSHFHVGAALLCENGEIITGTNFENAAYGSTICAERAAILRANSMGKRKFSKIAIYGRGENFESKDPVSPCGACRQVIMEVSQLSNTNIEIIMSNSAKDQIIVSTINELLPLGFGPHNLGIGI